MGVGLKLSGQPRNDDELRQFLYSVSCNPIATERIISELRETGTKLTTVQASLNFAYIGDELERLGIRMEIVEPVSTERLNSAALDYAALRLATGRDLPPLLDEEEAEEARRRAALAGTLDPSRLGAYQDV